MIDWLWPWVAFVDTPDGAKCAEEFTMAQGHSLSKFVHVIIVHLDHRFVMHATRKRLSLPSIIR
jgi:hypothetical protein